jgi:hypothetical protein
MACAICEWVLIRDLTMDFGIAILALLCVVIFFGGVLSFLER